MRAARAEARPGRVRRGLGYLKKRLLRLFNESYRKSTKALRIGRKRLAEVGRDEGRAPILTPAQQATRYRGAPFGDLPEVRDVVDRLRSLRESDAPVILGPWLSEIGFELLYWIPFLRWAKHFVGLPSERLVAVSRGGSGIWYGDIAARSIDVLSVLAREEFVAGNEARIAAQEGRQKHEAVSELDHEILSRVRRRLGLRRAEVLHPSCMYRLFDAFWMLQAPVELVRSYTLHRRLSANLRVHDRLGLSGPYVATKFYGNAGFPLDASNRRWAVDVIEALAERYDVVLLNTDLRLDDHGELETDTRERVHPAGGLMTPTNNLEIQTALIAGADAYVGTYGGFAYLAPMLGVDACTFYSDPERFRFDHRELAERVFAEVGGGAFAALDIRQAQVLTSLFETTGIPDPGASAS